MALNCTIEHQKCSIGDFKQAIYPVVYLLIFFVGLVANGIAVFLFLRMWRTQRTLSSVNMFMLNLSVSDLMLICSLPFRASYYLNDMHWVFGDVACRAMTYVFYVNMYGSVLFLMALSVIRYIAITKPYVYMRQQNNPHTWLLCLSIWLLVCLASIPNLFAGTEESDGQVRCLELLNPEVSQLSTLVIVNYAAFLLGFLLPFMVILVCYVIVVRRLLRQNSGQTSRQQYRKSCYLVVIVLAIFLACFLPYHVARSMFLQAEWDVCTGGLRDMCGYLSRVRKAAVITHSLASANSCLDPLLYFFVGENFRKFLWGSRKSRAKKIMKNVEGVARTEMHALTDRNEACKTERLTMEGCHQ